MAGSKTERFSGRYFHEAVGVIVLLTLAVALVGLLVATRWESWLAAENRFRLLLPPEGSGGLEAGAEVRMLGSLAGHVIEVRPTDAGRLVAELGLDPEWARFVCTDSRARVRKSLGFAGDALVEISIGEGERIPGERPELICTLDRDPVVTLEALLMELRDQIVPTLTEARATAKIYRELGASLQAPDGALVGLLGDARALVADLRHGEGLAPRLIRDPSLARAADESLARMGTSLERLDRMLVNLEGATERLPRIARSIESEVAELPRLVEQTVATLAEIERLVEGVQRHWLVRDYVEEKSARRRLDPSAGSAGGSP